MGERSDRAPLLDWEESPSAEKPGGAAPAAPQPEERQPSPRDGRVIKGCSAPGFGWSSGPGGPAPSGAVSGSEGCSPPPSTSGDPAGEDGRIRPDQEERPPGSAPRELSLQERMVKWEEKDQIVSVFVVTFNTRSGGGGMKYRTRNQQRYIKTKCKTFTGNKKEIGKDNVCRQKREKTDEACVI